MEAETVEWPSPAAVDQCINWGTGGTHTFVGRLISDARFVADPGLLGAHPVKRQNILKHYSAHWGTLHDSCRKNAALAHTLPWQDSLLSQLSSYPIDRAVLQTSQIWGRVPFIHWQVCVCQGIFCNTITGFLSIPGFNIHCTGSELLNLSKIGIYTVWI